MLFRGDNLVAIDSTWDGDPVPVPMTDGDVPRSARRSRRHEGRRPTRHRDPAGQGFGAEGNPQMGLPADTDIVMVVDLLGAY